MTPASRKPDTTPSELAVRIAAIFGGRDAHSTAVLQLIDAELQAVREALTFYATESNWERDTAGCGPAPTMGIPGTSLIESDNDGNAARMALKSLTPGGSQ